MKLFGLFFSSRLELFQNYFSFLPAFVVFEYEIPERFIGFPHLEVQNVLGGEFTELFEIFLFLSKLGVKVNRV